jgi:hypothetical protein
MADPAVALQPVGPHFTPAELKLQLPPAEQPIWTHGSSVREQPGLQQIPPKQNPDEQSPSPEHCAPGAVDLHCPPWHLPPLQAVPSGFGVKLHVP